MGGAESPNIGVFGHLPSVAQALLAMAGEDHIRLFHR